MSQPFEYDLAFSRNIGWVTRDEQRALRGKRVAIAGMGGVGGVHLMTLARLGIGHFRIADYDHFDIANFNRQAGALVSTLGQAKADVMARQARDVNPELDIEVFDRGVDAGNLPHFLDQVDLYIDGLDFFAFDARAATFAACAERGIPAITAAPLGMGAAVLNFLPGGMGFEDYFGWAGQPEDEKALRFLLGLAPAGLHFRYLADPSAVDLARRKGPSTIIACQLCAGMAAAEALKILLGRGDVRGAPHGHHFDAYRRAFVRTWRPGGNRNPLQRALIAVARRRLRARFAATPAAPASAVAMTASDPARPTMPDLPQPLARILDRARWAPSGDNTQPWRFRVTGALQLEVHGFDTRSHCVYDLDGRPSQISHGALLESLAVAASAEGLRSEVRRRPDAPETAPVYEVGFVADPAVRPSPLLGHLEQRCVQRRPLSTRPLTAAEKTALESALPAGWRAVWLETPAQRRAVAGLLFRNAGLRLTMPEAYEVHRDVIAWNTRFSEDRLPDQALGADAMTLKLMQRVMVSWERVEFFNRWLAGTVAPRLQMDWWPALRCAAHVLLLPPAPPRTIDDFVAGGRAVQRFWLTAASLGLQHQPEMTPLIFARYVREGRRFTRVDAVQAGAERLAHDFPAVTGVEPDSVVWLGRIGAGAAAQARSTRLPLATLLQSDAAALAVVAGPRQRRIS